MINAPLYLLGERIDIVRRDEEARLPVRDEFGNAPDIASDNEFLSREGLKNSNTKPFASGWDDKNIYLTQGRNEIWLESPKAHPLADACAATSKLEPFSLTAISDDCRVNVFILNCQPTKSFHENVAAFDRLESGDESDSWSPCGVIFLAAGEGVNRYSVIDELNAFGRNGEMSSKKLPDRF